LAPLPDNLTLKSSFQMDETRWKYLGAISGPQNKTGTP
jgi:hypothetical protein